MYTQIDACNTQHTYIHYIILHLCINIYDYIQQYVYIHTIYIKIHIRDEMQKFYINKITIDLPDNCMWRYNYIYVENIYIQCITKIYSKIIILYMYIYNNNAIIQYIY